MKTLNAAEALDRMRLKLHDVDDRVFTPAQKFFAMDDALSSIYGRIKLVGDSHSLDHIDVPIGSMTNLEQGVLEYDLPEEVSDIQYVELIVSIGQPGVPVPAGSFEDMNIGRGTLTSNRDLRWIRSSAGGPGSIQIRGRTGGALSFRIWHVRSWGPLHTGVAASGTTTTITVGTTLGNFKRRDGIYRNMMLEITADSGQPSNVGAVRRVSSFTAGVFTLQSALPAAASSTTQYAVLVPLPEESLPFFQAKSLRNLLLDAGNIEEAQVRVPEYAELEREFEASIRAQNNGEPIRFVNGRGSR